MESYWNEFSPYSDELDSMEALNLCYEKSPDQNFTLCVKEKQWSIKLNQNIPQDRHIEKLFVTVEEVKLVELLIGGCVILSLPASLLQILNPSDKKEVDILSPFGLVLPQLDALMYHEVRLAITYEDGTWRPTTIGFWLRDASEIEFKGALRFYQPIKLNQRDDYYIAQYLTSAMYLLLETREKKCLTINFADKDGNIKIADVKIPMTISSEYELVKLPQRRIHPDEYDFNRISGQNISDAFLIYPNLLYWSDGMCGCKYVYEFQYGIKKHFRKKKDS